MKSAKTCFLLLALCGGPFLVQPASAQIRLVTSVIGASSGFVSNDSLQMNITIGQPLVGVVQNSSYILRSGFWHQTSSFITDVEEVQGTSLPTEFRVRQNYPNPFNPSTIISYALPEQSLVSLRIYDVLGRLVQTLIHETQAPGVYKFNFDASRLASGVYFYRLVAGSFVDTKKLVLVR
jgi:hypothetical protein